MSDGLGEGMQDIDRPPDIQPLHEPTRTPRPRVDTKALRVMRRAQGLDRITRHFGRRRPLRQRAPVRPPELERPVGPARDLIALLMDRPMMPTTEHGEVRECGGAAVRPVTDVMPLAEREPAAREAATLIPVMERAARVRTGPAEIAFTRMFRGPSS